jgi:hypothetical protein
LPEHHSVRGRQLHRAAGGRHDAVDLAVIVLFSIFFWTFLWGLFGTFIGVPIALAILTFCAAHPSSAGSPTCSADRIRLKPGKL